MVRIGTPRLTGFTLIELLVVIAIIALLVTILVPSLSEAKWLAMIGKCSSAQHGVGLAAGMYSSSYGMDRPWLFYDGTGDGPTESGSWNNWAYPQPGNPGRALINEDCGEVFMDDASAFFCPIYPATWENDYDMNGDDGGPYMWGTYRYVYPVIRASDDPDDGGGHMNKLDNANPAAEYALMVDFEVEGWLNGLAGRLRGAPIYEHYNAVFSDGHVELVGRSTPDVRKFLWGPNREPYSGWSGY